MSTVGENGHVDQAFQVSGVGRDVRDLAWSATPLGPAAQWPQSLRTIVDLMLGSKFPMCIGWGAELTMLYNDAYLPFLGSKPLSLGRPMAGVWEDIWPDIEPLILMTLSGESVAYDDLPLTMDRRGYPEETWWSFSYSPLRDDAGEIAGFLNVATETTEKRRALTQLEALNATLEERVAELAAERDQLWRLSRDPFVIADMQGRWQSVSPVWTELLGWSVEELTGSTSAWIEHPADLAKSASEIVFVAGGGVMVGFTNRLRCKEGGYRTFSWSGVAEGGRMFCVARDVTDEMKRAEELRLYANIVQSDTAPVCAFDTDYRLIAFNQAHSDEFYRIYGYRVQVGDVFPDLFLPDQAPIMRGFMRRALSGEVFTVTEEFGDPKLVIPYWQVTYNPIRDANGEIVGAFHHAIDITDRLRAEAELGETQDALRQAQKMEAIGQLTGGVAHDFNNLLTVIQGSVDLLKREGVPAAKRERYLNAIDETAERAAKLTGQLLAFARRQTLAPETFDVGSRLDSVSEMLDSVTGAHVAVRFEAPDRQCLVRADVSQFETALVNLAVNARDAMPNGGNITIRFDPEATLPEIRGHGARAGSFVAVSVADTGSGIDPVDLQRIFEPFFTTKQVGRGTGLGLSQVIGFAKQSGGDVDVETSPGHGSTFTLFLPRVEEDGPRQAAPQHDNAVVDGGGRRVLLVEDNLGVGQFASQVLQDLNFSTDWAMNAEEALDRLGPDGGGFDIVFSDVVMPGMGGIELARRLARDLPHLPVVLASGYSHVLAQEGTEGLQLLRKPYSAVQLSTILERRMAEVVIRD